MKYPPSLFSGLRICPQVLHIHAVRPKSFDIGNCSCFYLNCVKSIGRWHFGNPMLWIRIRSFFDQKIKRTSSKKWNFINFFLFRWVIFALQDPSPDCESVSRDLIEVVSNADPDPPTLFTVHISEWSKELQNGDQELPEGQTGGRRVGSVDDAAHWRPCKGGSHEFFYVSDVVTTIYMFSKQFNSSWKFSRWMFGRNRF